MTTSRPTEQTNLIDIEIYGRKERCRVLAEHDHGTLDVERLSDGRCFRILIDTPGTRIESPEKPV